jgi:hypothetical protein
MPAARIIMLAIICAAWATPVWAAADNKISPLPNPITGTVTITVTVTGISKLGEIRIKLDGGPLASCSKSPCETPWSSNSVADGPHAIKVKAFNRKGTLQGSRKLTVLVENQRDPSGAGPAIAGCRVFPPDNAWNTDVSAWPVHPSSANFLAAIGAGNLHPDFGDIYGIPFTTVPGSQPRVPVSFYYDDESDPGPYPIPPDAPVEGGSDRHVLVLDRDRCVLYEMFDAERAGAGWTAGAGAVWDFNINATRPETWTSADAAGLPILPGLVRYDEVVEQGEINHAVRFTVRRTQKGYVAPASHWASSSTDPNLPPMGLRLRLNTHFDISGFHPQVQVILRALKTYGMIVADNGSSWFITGELNPRWDNEILDELKTVAGSHFEVVDTGPIIKP